MIVFVVIDRSVKDLEAMGDEKNVAHPFVYGDFIYIGSLGEKTTSKKY